jgi:hypothetical protein
MERTVQDLRYAVRSLFRHAPRPRILAAMTLVDGGYVRRLLQSRAAALRWRRSERSDG